MFGLLGLVPHHARIEIRYDKTVKEVCEDVIRKVIREEHYPLRMLFMEFGKNLKQWFDLPDLDVERLVDLELSKRSRLSITI